MQIEVNRKEFISALNVGGSMAGRVKTIPILEDVKITIKGTSAVISSFDNETAITKKDLYREFYRKMRCSASTPRNLVNILKTIKDENVSLCRRECMYRCSLPRERLRFRRASH